MPRKTKLEACPVDAECKKATHDKYPVAIMPKKVD